MTTNGSTALVPHTPQRVGQGTAVEQSRAVAEVEAAVIVAQRMPRDVSRADADMRRSCAQESLAQKAFFRYSRGGSQITGPSVQLARELARCFGNLQYGLVELRRDDDYAQSEMLAFAWDVQTNTRSSTTFIVPHKRDKTGGPVNLTDMRDIYENNANNGARRLREMIFAILPGWYTEAAVAACYETLNGDATDLPERVAKCIEGYGGRGISLKQLEQKLGAPRSAWTAGDLAQLQVIWRSLQRGEISKDEEFPASNAVTAADIIGQKTPAAEDDTRSQPARSADTTGGQDQSTGEDKSRHGPGLPGATATRGAQPPPPQDQAPHRVQSGKAGLDKLTALYEQLSLDDEEQATVTAWFAPGEWTASAPQVKQVTDGLKGFLTDAGGDVAEARTALWAQYRKVRGDADPS